MTQKPTALVFLSIKAHNDPHFFFVLWYDQTTMHSTKNSPLAQAKELIQSVSGKPQTRQERQTIAIQLAGLMLEEANASETRKEQAQQAQLSRMMQDPKGKAFTTSMTDQCFRSHTPSRIANQLVYLLEQFGVPAYLSAAKRFQLSAFRLLGQAFATVLVPLAMEALRKETASVILPGEPEALSRHMRLRRQQGVRLNLNYLGEAILSEAEAKRRLTVYLEALKRDDVEYVSVKISTLYSQIHLLGWEDTLTKLKNQLRQLYRLCLQCRFTRADGTQVPKFVNLDMEEYRDLHLTKALFQELLDEPEFSTLSAGIVLQAYLPDSFPLQQELTSWAMDRVRGGSAPIKIRIVKGANLAMEQFEASLRGWNQAPYRHKLEVDANYKRMVEYGVQKEHAHAVYIGIGSHNLFDIAYSLVLRAENQVESQVSFEMLEGMAEPMRRVVQALSGSMLLYCPAATRDDFQSAVAYLIRRLDENTGPDNFLRHVFGLAPGTAAWEEQVLRFQQACQMIDTVSKAPRRSQNRLVPPDMTNIEAPFENEPDTDFSLADNRVWGQRLMTDWRERSFPLVPLVIAGQELSTNLPQEQGFDPSRPSQPLYRYTLAHWEQIDQALTTAKITESTWTKTTPAQRNQILFQVAQKLRERRSDLCGVMMADAGKSLLEADPEVSEAIDFAEYYRRSLLDVISHPDLFFAPKGTVLITPPWNFPISIPAGGILAALAAGNCVLFKPAPEAVLCGWILVNAFWDAGVPKEVLQFINCADEPVGSRLIADSRLSAIVLTGATSTALLFRRLNPFVPLYAETGGKNAIIITALADRDLAIKDLVQSAFGHAGQKCSAASLAILEAEVYDDPHFRKQLHDAVVSLQVGSAWDPASKVTPLIRHPGETLLRGFTTLDEGEEWLVVPKPDPQNPNLWSPGVKLGVLPGSFTHQNELFGPVLGIMRADNLDQAIDFANGTPYGLTSGLQSLDEREQQHWSQRIIAGNCYINRTVTGAIVERQPFGGVKGSSFGTGAKAGGPNYVAQLMNVIQVKLPPQETSGVGLQRKLAPLFQAARLSEKEQSVWEASRSSYVDFAHQFREGYDVAKIVGQDNIFQYRAFDSMVYRIQPNDTSLHLLQVIAAALSVGCPLEISYLPEQTPILPKDEWLPNLMPLRFTPETILDFEERVRRGTWSRIRLTSPAREALIRAAATLGVTMIGAPVLSNGRFELLHYLRELSLSIDYHRYGNLGVREQEPRKLVS